MRFIGIVIIAICLMAILFSTAQGKCQVGCTCGDPNCNCGETGQCGSPTPTSQQTVVTTVLEGGIAGASSGGDISPTIKYTGSDSLRKFIESRDRKVAESLLLKFLHSNNPRVQVMGIVGIKELYRGVKPEDYPFSIKYELGQIRFNDWDALNTLIGLTGTGSLGSDE